MKPADILVVDDNPDNISLLAGILRARGYRVRWATSGIRALAAAKAELPDLVMLDITMPEMDGFTVCARLKGDPATREVPIIFISALDDALDKVRAFQVGGVDYVTKPFQGEEVVARVENHLRIASLQRELERQNAELSRKNRELMEARFESRLAFSALAEALPGNTLVGRYRLQEKIGAGGFGAVYRARDLVLERPVAVKVLRPLGEADTTEGLERFRREGITTCRVQHPNAVTLFDIAVSDEGMPFLVMELLEGRPLSAELSEKGKLGVSRSIEVIAPVCRALAAAHAAGVIHRDIKPANVFLHRTSEGEVVKILDFGIATLRGRPATELDLGQITSTGVVVGSLSYLAPERIDGRPYDEKADVYSLGVVMHQLVAGRLPYGSPGSDAARLAFLAGSGTPLPLRALEPTVPEALEQLVLDALARDPAARPTAAQFRERLEAVSVLGQKPDGPPQVERASTAADSADAPTAVMAPAPDGKADGRLPTEKSGPRAFEPAVTRRGEGEGP